ncbi:MAG: hypothetical protein ABI240_13385 [Sphingomonas sp.]
MMWLISVETAAAAAFAHALTLSATLPDDRAVTLPALRLTMSDLVATVARQTGGDPALVTYLPDDAIEAGFGAQPTLSTPRARTLGFHHDGTVDRLVASALATIASTEGTGS